MLQAFKGRPPAGAGKTLKENEPAAQFGIEELAEGTPGDVRRKRHWGTVSQFSGRIERKARSSKGKKPKTFAKNPHPGASLVRKVGGHRKKKKEVSETETGGPGWLDMSMLAALLSLTQKEDKVRGGGFKRREWTTRELRDIRSLMRKWGGGQARTIKSPKRKDEKKKRSSTRT